MFTVVLGFAWANSGANSPNASLPAVCTIFSAIFLPPYSFTFQKEDASW